MRWPPSLPQHPPMTSAPWVAQRGIPSQSPLAALLGTARHTPSLSPSGLLVGAVPAGSDGQQVWGGPVVQGGSCAGCLPIPLRSGDAGTVPSPHGKQGQAESVDVLWRVPSWDLCPRRWFCWFWTPPCVWTCAENTPYGSRGTGGSGSQMIFVYLFVCVYAYARTTDRSTCKILSQAFQEGKWLL